MMASEVFLREDLAAILAALAVTAAIGSGHTPSDQQFQRGFAAALVAVGVAVHITPEELRMLTGRGVDATAGGALIERRNDWGQAERLPWREG